MFLFGPVLVLLQQLVLFSEFEDEGIELLVVDFDAFEFEDLGFELVDNDVLLVIFCLRQLVGPDGCLCVVEVFAVHA